MTDAARLSRDAVARLSERLRDECERLARDLLPGGELSRGIYRAARRSVGGPGDSLTVYTRGTRQGKWQHFGGEIGGMTHGDMLDLIMATQRLTKEDARAWALRWLGLAPGAVEYRRTPAEEAAALKAASEKRREQMEKIDRRRKSDRTLWLTCPGLSLENASGRYMAGRIPGFAALLELGWGLNALRHHPALLHPYAEDRRAFPAMLAVCQFPDGKLAALHRYFLREVEAEGGGKRWDVLRQERDGLKGKLASTELNGAFVPVWRGSRIDEKTGEVKPGLPWRDPKAGPEIVMCEGVEDAATLALVDKDRRYAAALSLPNFMQIKVPDWCKRLVWFADDDGDNQQTPELLDRALDRLDGMGIDVAIARPPQGFKDANAALRGATT